MARYLLKRLLMVIPVFFGITLLVYMLASLAPGNAVDILMADPYSTVADMEKKRIELGLDQPIYVQYGNWLGQIMQGDLGYSFRTYQPVWAMIRIRIIPTLVLTVSSTILSLVISIPLGTLAAYRPYSSLDYMSTGISFVGVSAPNFFIGLVLIFIFSVKLHILPMGGMYDTGSTGQNPGALLRHLIMPAVVLSIQQIGSFTRHMRSSVLEVLGEDYIRTAKSKGLSEFWVVLKHGLRNAMIPIVTLLGIQIPFLIGGAVVTEQIFGWPGLGSLMVQSILMRDYPVIMGITVVLAIAVLVGNILIDLIYGLLDPRIRFS